MTEQRNAPCWTEMGAGIGPLITPEEGRARLNAYVDWCAKITPGPWQRKDDYGGYNVIIGNVDGESFSDGTQTYSYDFIANCEDEFGEQTSPANSRLVLAAPDMLTALKKIAAGEGDAREIAEAALARAAR
jgi:hypothetical protein